jgi:Abnormal spindle-like microcephaly-assoc'd, ASPM-SPD-2-Hydin
MSRGPGNERLSYLRVTSPGGVSRLSSRKLVVLTVAVHGQERGRMRPRRPLRTASVVAALISLAMLAGCASTGATPNNTNTGGSGGPAIAVSPTAVNFGSVTAGSSAAQTVTLTNNGSSTLTVDTLTTTGAAFSVIGPTLPANVAAGQSVTAQVKFAPTAAGTYSGALSATSNATNSLGSIPLSGTATTSTTTTLLSVSPTSLAFGTVAVGASASQTVTLSNTGNTGVTVSGANVSGASYSVSGLTLPATIAAGKQLTAGIIFTPLLSGAANGSVAFVSNATNSPANVSMTGSGSVTTAHSVDLSWTASTSTVAGYNVYRAIQSGGPYAIVSGAPVAATAFNDANVTSGATYFYVVTAVDGQGVESVFSNEATAAIP